MYRVSLSRVLRQLSFIFAVAAVSTSAFAQSALNPSWVEFTPSPDDALTSADGRAIVSEYQLAIYVVGQSSAVRTISLGKPAVDPDNKVRVDFRSLMAPFASVGVTYEARVMANGPGGSAVSAVSNQFQYTSCTATLSAGAFSAPAAGGATSTSVTVDSSCAWTATTDASWLNVTSAASGIGAGTVSVAVSPTNTQSSRTGVLTIAGQAFTVTQAGAACTISLASSSAPADSVGGNGQLTVSAPLGCPWTVSSSASWLTVKTPSASSGADVIGYSSAANTTLSPRTAALTIAGQTFTVTQSAASCSIGLAPTLLPLAAQVTVSGVSAYTWAASTTDVVALQRSAATDRLKAAWYGDAFSIDVNVGAGRTEQIALYVADYDNNGRVQRFDVVDQSGALLDTQTVSGFGAGRYLVWSVRGHVTINVTKVTGANAVVSGILVGSGSANGGAAAASFVKADNGTQGSWKGVYGEDGYTVAGDAASQRLAASGGSGSAAVTTATGCAWTAESSAPWLTVTAASGSGSGTATMSVAPNTTGVLRTATLTVGGQTLSMTQAAQVDPLCSVALATTAQAVAAAGGTGSVAVTAAGTCNWTASSDAAWLTVTSGSNGTGNGTVAFSAAVNPTAPGRIANVTIGGQIFTVTQAAGPVVNCTVSLSTSSQAFVAAGGSGSVAVSVGSGCGWTASSSAAWLTVTSGANGSGPGTVAFSVAPNAGSSQRSATLTIGAQSFTVTQTGAPCSVAITPAGLPVPASLAVNGASSWTWLSGTSESGALERATTDRVMAAWYGDTFTIDVNVASGRAQQLAVYAIDYDADGREQRYELLDQSGVTLDARSLTSFSGGKYVVWTVTGHVTLRVTKVTGTNAVVSGVFLGEPPAGAAATGTSASFLKTDDTTAGSWKGVYGAYGYTIASDSAAQFLDPRGGTGSVTVTAGATCAWTATSDAAWVTFSTGTGTGSGNAAFTVAPTTSTSARTATLTIGGQTLTLTQAPQTASPCSYSLSTTAQSATAAATNSSITVTASSGCWWTAVSNAPWITVTGGASGSGSGAVNITVAANPTTTVRVGTVTIAGQTLTVTQAAAPCTYVLATTAQSFTAAAGTGSVNVTAATGCGWTATSNAAWMTVTAGASGAANGTVTYSVAANTTATTRTATLTIAGQTYTVTQAGVPCTYTISATSQAFAAPGGTGTVTVTAPAGCAWTSSSNASWLTVTSGGSGNGTSTLTFSVAVNTGTTARSAALTIAGQTFTVNEANTPCTFTVSATSQSLTTAAGGGTITVTAPSGCAWTSSSSASWLIVTSGGSGNGTGTLTFAATANTGQTPRTATLTVAGQTVTVTQAGAPCTFTISTASQSFTAVAGSGSVAVTAPASCAWTTTTNAVWLTPTAGGSGTGPGTVSFSVAANTSTTARTAALTIGGQTFTVTQAGAPTCAVTVSPGTVAINSKKASGSVSVTNPTSCAWTATSSAAWLTVTNAQVLQGTVSYGVTVNNTGASRVGVITIGSATFTVTQSNNGTPAVVTGLRVVAEGQ